MVAVTEPTVPIGRSRGSGDAITVVVPVYVMGEAFAVETTNNRAAMPSRSVRMEADFSTPPRSLQRRTKSGMGTTSRRFDGQVSRRSVRTSTRLHSARAPEAQAGLI